MAPIRVGFIGLSQKSWARNAHLPYLQASSDFQITAVCNSSLKSAEAAISFFNLPTTTTPYGNFSDLAKDPNVDLIVVSVKAPLHHAAVTPAIKAGKDVYVEWPLGRTVAEAKEILELSKKCGTKLAIVGLQGRFSPVVQKIKEIVNGEKLGKVLSSTFTSQATYGGGVVVKGFEYALKLESGAGLVGIFCGHTFDYIHEVLGEFDTETTQSLLATKRNIVDVIDPVTGDVIGKEERTAHDTVLVHGALQSKAVISITLRGGPGFKDTPTVDWRILCQKGEIRITANGLALQMGDQGAKIEVFDYATNEVEVAKYEDDFDAHPLATEKGLKDDQLNQEPTKRADMVWRNVARVYAAIARGEKPGVAGSTLVDFETALSRQEFLEKMMAGRHF